MRRRAALKASSLVLVCAVILAAAPCYSSTVSPDAVVVKKYSVRITVDPRTELLSIVQYLSQYRDPNEPLIAREQFRYRADVDAHFARFAEHPAVRMMTRLSKEGCSFSWPAVLVLRSDQNLRLRNDLKPTRYLDLACGSDRQLQDLTDELRSFSEQTRFAAFFKAERAFYSELEKELAANLDRDYVRELENFYGVRYSGYDIILVPLYGPVGYGPVLETTRGEKHIYAILGTHSVREGRPRFADKAYLADMQRHEFSHSFVNPLTARFSEEAKKSSSLLRRMTLAQKNGVCGEWEECLNESVVRAVTTHLAFAQSQQAGEDALKEELSRGAVLTPLLLELLREYSNQRAEYPDFTSYYPVLLSRLAQEDLQRTAE